jgi:S-adenosylmethionine:tRNA ribosyltransferase-isomerase
MHPKHLRIEDFSYSLPEEKIAQYPLPERDASRLLIYDQSRLAEDHYRNIAAHIPSGSMVVFNQTRVVHVRLLFRKESGARIEIFCLEPDDRYTDIYSALNSTGLVYWRCMIGGAGKWKDGQILRLVDQQKELELQAQLLERHDGYFTILLRWQPEAWTFAEILQHFGRVPLPPYMQRELKEEDTERYQTIYAQVGGSVAAPTAGLHFTDRIFDQFKDKSIVAEYLTLHVGAGTFKQVKSEEIGGHEMHAEWMEIDREQILRLLNVPHRTAVGTTSLRFLESLYWLGVKLIQGNNILWNGVAVEQWDPYVLPDNISVEDALTHLADFLEKHTPEGKIATRTGILIAPGYKVRMVGQLVTNFHQPGSTLLLLIAALMGDDWKMLYQYALDNNFRFLSYGDGCLINLPQ